MARKADLVAEAEARGIDVPPKATVADLEEMLADYQTPQLDPRYVRGRKVCPVCGKVANHVHG